VYCSDSHFFIKDLRPTVKTTCVTAENVQQAITGMHHPYSSTPKRSYHAASHTIDQFPASANRPTQAIGIRKAFLCLACRQTHDVLLIR